MKNSPAHRFWLLPATLAVLLINGTALAHSGGTNASGCHTNHSTGDYHCHNSGTSGGGSTGGSYTPSYSSPKTTCGFDSYESSYGTCTKYPDPTTGTKTKLIQSSCPLGQFSVGDECLAAPQACAKRHGTYAEYSYDGECWCRDGYEFSGNICKFVNKATNGRNDAVERINRKAQRNVTSVSSKSASSVALQTEKAKVLSVVDGDTIKVKLGTKTETIRIIGIDTPETVDPRKPVQCYGKEASAQTKRLLSRKTVTLEKNPAEERDKYGRLLRYVLIGSKDVGATLIQDGYAFSYKTFPHPKLDAYNALELKAQETKKGLWGSTCNTPVSTSSKAKTSSSSSKATTSGVCDIKGNINSSGEKIFHMPGCGSYKQTVINTSDGERMFCSESEALNAGWRKALNCP